MFGDRALRALESDSRIMVRAGRLVIAWSLLHASFRVRRALADRIGGNHIFAKVKKTLVGVPPNWLERRIIAAAKAARHDRLCAIVASALFQHGYEFLVDGLDWADRELVACPYLG